MAVATATPAMASRDAYAYACKGADKGVYKICIYNKTGVKISGKTFSNAQNGIKIKSSSNITISGNTFKGLGGSKGYAGVHVQNSTNIVIKGNTFSGLSNEGYMHGVYLVRTSASRVTGNKFSYITGDPVRIRDGSRNNIVSGNKFVRSGVNAIFSEWGKLPPYGLEKCGSGNVFMNNKYGNGYSNKSIMMIEWGGKGGGKSGPLSWRNCSEASIKDGGGNKKI